jgi:GAF domain-containing protein
MPDRERLAREQTALAELGRRVITPMELGRILQGAIELVAETLGAQHATVLELSPDGHDLRLRAGVGWEEGAIGHRVALAPGAQVSYVLDASEAVIVDDLRSEDRFEASPILLGLGVRASLAVRIPAPGQRPFGVIGAHSTEQGVFSAQDGQFLAGVAGVLSSAIARHRRAIEMNDEILQTLVLAQYALHQGRDDTAALLDKAVAHTRSMITRLLGDSEGGQMGTLPGDLRRQAPPQVSDQE